MGNTTYLNAIRGASSSRAETKTDEKPLVRRLKRRDEAAFKQLVKRHKSLVYNVCLRMLSNSEEAEDIAQDVFVRAFLSIGSFREEARLSTWLYRIAVNLCKNRLKYYSRRSAKLHSSIDFVAEKNLRNGCGQITGEATPGPDQTLEAFQTENLIQEALMSVDEDFRKLLILRDIEGLSYIDIMRVTGLPEGTVKSRLHRARTALTRAFKKAQSNGTV